MRKQKKLFLLRQMTLALALSFAFLSAFQTEITAQDTDFKPGEKVEYRESDYATEWKEGVVVKILPGNTQVLIRSKPDQYFKEGFEQAYVFSRVRRIANRPASQPTMTNTIDVAKNVDKTNTEIAKTDGKGLMTKEEIFSYLKTNLPKAPDDPIAAEVSKQLVKEIKRRGVEYFKVEDRDIYNVFMRYDPRHDQVVMAIRENYGAPPPQSWLTGAWKMTVVDVGYNYSIGAKAGFLTISKNGTYQWKPGPNDAVINGKWREATDKEMWHQGGAGIVLLKGEGGDDWIARKSTNRELKGDHIDVALLDMTYRSGKRRIGRR